jgi:hypothetical protein
MPINYHFGTSLETLEASLAERQEDLREGSLLIASGAGDVNTQRQINDSIKGIIEELLRALHRLDPVKYPADQITREERTGVNFS